MEIFCAIIVDSIHPRPARRWDDLPIWYPTMEVHKRRDDNLSPSRVFAGSEARKEKEAQTTRFHFQPSRPPAASSLGILYFRLIELMGVLST